MKEKLNKTPFFPNFSSKCEKISTHFANTFLKNAPISFWRLELFFSKLFFPKKESTQYTGSIVNPSKNVPNVLVRNK